MAGVARFELTNAGIKTPCLTAWRYPSDNPQTWAERTKINPVCSSDFYIILLKTAVVKDFLCPFTQPFTTLYRLYFTQTNFLISRTSAPNPSIIPEHPANTIPVFIGMFFMLIILEEVSSDIIPSSFSYVVL